MVSLEWLGRTVRYALRNLVRRPGFTTAAVLSLALGMGATSTIFSFLDAALLRPLDVPRPGELVKIRATTPQFRFGRHTYREFTAFRDRNRTLSGLVAHSTAFVSVRSRREPQPRLAYSELVNGDFFRTLKVPAAFGRTLTANDDTPGAPLVAVLSHRSWVTRFHADPDAVGSAVTLNNQPAVIVGVVSQAFGGPDVYERPEMYVPLAAAARLFPFDRPLEDPAHQPHLVLLGRLRSGASVEAAQADVSRIADQLKTEYAATNRERSAVVMGEVASRFALSSQLPVLTVLLATLASFVLLIACINVANLLLGRAAARNHEFTIRTALGASRPRLVGQLLTESVVLSALGVAAGLLLATWAIRFFATLQILSDTPMQLDARLDVRVLLATLGAMALSAAIFGVWPALRASRVDLTPHGAVERSSRYGGRHLLVAGQTSLAAALLVIARLYLKSFAAHREELARLVRVTRLDRGHFEDGVCVGRHGLRRFGQRPGRIRGGAQECERQGLPALRERAANGVAVGAERPFVGGNDPGERHPERGALERDHAGRNRAGGLIDAVHQRFQGPVVRARDYENEAQVASGLEGALPVA